jgi:hypothetical protein
MIADFFNFFYKTVERAFILAGFLGIGNRSGHIPTFQYTIYHSDIGTGILCWIVDSIGGDVAFGASLS